MQLVSSFWYLNIYIDDLTHGISLSDAINEIHRTRTARARDKGLGHYQGGKSLIYKHTFGKLSSLYDCRSPSSFFGNGADAANEPWFTSFCNCHDPTTVDFIYFTPTFIEASGYFTVS